MNILFVCTGNTCRSPMAEALLKDKYPSASVQSAGVFAENGALASKNTIEALKEVQIDCVYHRSQPVTDELLHWADLVLTMTVQHKQVLLMKHPHYERKYFTLKEYVSLPNDEEIQELQAKIEAKRRKFITDHPELSKQELEQQLEDHVKKDREKLLELERASYDQDISDPFGGELSLYRATRMELEQLMDRLISKMKASKGE